jgi:transposase
VEVVKEALSLYSQRYFDFNVLHFQHRLKEDHGMELSYSWVKNLLQTAGLVAKGKRKSPHRKARPGRPLSPHYSRSVDNRNYLIEIFG